eukprot:3494638-Rhodomonas_salina.1
MASIAAGSTLVAPYPRLVPHILLADTLAQYRTLCRHTLAQYRTSCRLKAPYARSVPHIA